MDDRELERMLQELELDAPDEELTQAVNPWRTAMNRVLWGMALCAITLNFWNLDNILPAIGMLLTLLGYRALRKENGWFRLAYGLTLIRAVSTLFSLFIQATVYGNDFLQSEAGIVLSFVMMFVVLLSVLALRNGLKAVQAKAGLEPKVGSATAMFLWYCIVAVLGVFRVESFLVFIPIVGYFCILRGLYKCSRLLDEAGYAVAPAANRISDRAVKWGWWAAIAILLTIGYTCFNKYPMEFSPAETNQNVEIRENLLDLGFPESVLNDLSEEELLACDGASIVLVEVRDYDMIQGRGIGTQAEIDNGKVALITADEGEAHLRITQIGVGFRSGERKKFQIIQHFEWLTPDFHGTESIQLWPSDHNDGWIVGSEFTGRVLYDLDGQTLAAPYYLLGRLSYQSDSIFWGTQSRRDVFANFSLPEEGSRHRGYITFTLEELEPGWIVDCWFNYNHQMSWLQYPVRTAMEDQTLGFGSNDYAFQRIQTALQFTTHQEEPKLFD